MASPLRPKRLVLALGLAVLCVAAAAQTDTRLPDLGSSANALISDQEAQDYGAQMLHQMRALDMVVDDPVLDEYINDLGFRLVANSAKPREHFAFFIAKDEVINAFSAPGGYIGVNSGLIVITRNENELAAVIAHEIGHITQNHLQRAYEAARKETPLLALIALGAIAAGAGPHSGDATGAILSGGLGAMQQKEINFTRKDEAEADRVGIQTLARSGFDPNAMADFFEHMADVMSAGSYEKDVPSLLQDHPVTAERIADAKGRASALIALQKQHFTRLDSDDSAFSRTLVPVPYVRNPAALLSVGDGNGNLERYPLMRERVRVLTGDATSLCSYYASNLASHKEFDTPANHYGYALALTLTNHGDKAAEQLQPLLAQHPGDPLLRLAMADAEFQGGRRAAALTIYKSLSDGSPRNHAYALAYSKALTQGGDTTDALHAANLLRPLLDDNDEPDIYLSYARASEKAGDAIRADEAYANASYLAGRPFDAMEQLKRLLQRKDLDYYARARIQARIADLTPLVLELRKRHIQTDDNPDGRSRQ